MSSDSLVTASDLLESAAETTDDHVDRLTDLSEQLADLAGGESDPDHGRLARIQQAIGDVSDDVDDETAETLVEADDAINAFRETLEGV